MDNYVPFSDPWLLCWLGDGEVGASGGWCSVIIASLLVANSPLPWPRPSAAQHRHCRQSLQRCSTSAQPITGAPATKIYGRQYNW